MTAVHVPSIPATSQASAVSAEASVGDAGGTLVFEDVGSTMRLALARPRFAEALRALSRWISLTLPLSWLRVENAAMRHFYDRFYGPEAGAVPLLSFYRDYFVGFLNGSSSRSRLGAGFSLADFPLHESVRALRTRLADAVRDRWAADPDASFLRLEETDLVFLEEAAPTHGFPCSVAVFVQPLRDGSLVLPHGNFNPGFGKFVSRFLDVLDPDFAEAVRQGNRGTPEEVLAEILGDDNFNANLHPELLDHAVVAPWTRLHPGLVGRPVPVEELAVVRQGSDTLRLSRQADGRTVFPIDLGFLDARQRSPLDRLMACFGPPCSFSMTLPWLADPGKVRRPRIVFSGKIVLGRATWRFSRSLLPVPEPNEGEGAWFVRLREWRKRWCLPEEAFFRVRDPREAYTDTPFLRAGELDRAGLAGWRRAQLLDFRNPFSVNTWRKAVKQVAAADRETVVEFQEMLPGPEDLPEVAGRRRCLEVVVPLRFPSGQANPPESVA
jgi:hypothetical protein